MYPQSSRRMGDPFAYLSFHQKFRIIRRPSSQVRRPTPPSSSSDRPGCRLAGVVVFRFASVALQLVDVLLYSEVYSEIYQVTGPVERFAGQIASHGYVVGEFARSSIAIALYSNRAPALLLSLPLVLPRVRGARGNSIRHRRSVCSTPCCWLGFLIKSCSKGLTEATNIRQRTAPLLRVLFFLKILICILQVEKEVAAYDEVDNIDVHVLIHCQLIV